MFQELFYLKLTDQLNPVFQKDARKNVLGRATAAKVLAGSLRNLSRLPLLQKDLAVLSVAPTGAENVQYVLEIKNLLLYLLY